MKTIIVVVLVLVLAGCTSQEKKPTKTITVIGPVMPVNTNSPFYKK